MEKRADDEFCVIVCAFGRYCKFAPLFTGSMLLSYPNAFVRLYMRNVPAEVEEQFAAIRKHISNRFTIVQPWCINRKPHKDLRTERWFVNPVPLLHFKYCYWCDIDFIVLPLYEDLLGMHIKHMHELGVPYSNMARRTHKDKFRKKLTGLHFIETEPYYARMAPLLSTFDNRRINDEVLLFRMVTKAFGTIPFELMRKHVFRPHHGVHLAETRKPLGRMPSKKLRDMRWTYFSSEGRGAGLLTMMQHEHMGRLIREMADSNYQVANAVNMSLALKAEQRI